MAILTVSVTPAAWNTACSTARLVERSRSEAREDYRNVTTGFFFCDDEKKQQSTPVQWKRTTSAALCSLSQRRRGAAMPLLE
jgi:hypothetical protein